MKNSVNLFPYQEEAVQKLVSSSKELLISKEQEKYILLKAITGAGKTVMVGSYIEEMCRLYKDLVFIWISVGKGSLHKQSGNSLQNILPTHSIKFANHALTQPYLTPGDILILNWESLNTTKVIEDEVYFDNIFMKDGDRPNLQDLWNKTRDNNTKIILLIDESHYMAGSDTSKLIIDLINPVFTIEFTATPNKKRIPNREDEDKKKSFYVPVKTKDVVDSGVIKKSIKINDSINLENNLDACQQLLHIALEQYNRLKEAYLLENVDINPLCLIQLPDGKLSEELVITIKEYLKSKDVTVENGKLAIWLSKDHIGLEDITELNSKVSFLIFKQAIVTGWDCPRSSILVKLRETKSETFDLQTVGRILRMPERHHYDEDVLNHGYIITNANYNCAVEDYSEVLPIRQVLKEEFKQEILNLKFPVTTKRFAKLNVDHEIFEINLQNQFAKLQFTFDFSSLCNVFTTYSVESTELQNENSNNIATITNSSAYTENDINFEYRSFLLDVCKGPYTEQLIDTTLHRYFKKNTEYKTSKEIRQIVLVNQDKIKQAIKAIKDENHKKRQVTSVPGEFSFKEDRHTNSKETIDYKKCAYYKHFVSTWETEKRFEEYLENAEQVKWWIKNADSGDGLCMTYKYGEETRDFYPDYVVCFVDNRLGLYEVKDFNDKEKHTVTHEKIIALKNYMLEHGYLGGLVEVLHNEVHLPTLPKELLKS